MYWLQENKVDIAIYVFHISNILTYTKTLIYLDMGIY